MAFVASSRELVPVDLGLSVPQARLAMVCSREPIPFAWICMSFCITGFQLVLQACLAIFYLYNTYI